ncbi:MAG: SDR family oxidoreductase [Ktedonobacteraceae bacterium]|nr:SDR family oxidoreductase [Ktedonobacteraceae bacterium]
MSETNLSMDGKICMVTGANSGIGKVTALELAKLGAIVVMVCRDRQRGEAAQYEIKQQSGNDNVDLLLADLSSQQSIQDLVERFKARYDHLHVLVNNAGSVFLSRQLSVDGIEMTLAVNYLSVFLLTNLLLDTLKASAPARIVIVSSISHYRGKIDLDDLQMTKGYRLMRAYENTKLMGVLFTYALARRLEGTGVTANCLHPGTVATNIWSSPLKGFWRRLLGNPINLIARRFGITPEEGAKTTLYLATSPEVEGVSGKYFDQCKARRSARTSYHEELQERLWEASTKLTRLA